MGGEIYTREDLEKKKYKELQEIWRSLGAHNSKKRIKAEKLIESILDTQDQNQLSGDASAVADAFQEAMDVENAAQHPSSEEQDKSSPDELLTGITAPDFSSLDDVDQNSSEKLATEEKDTNKQRKRTSTFDLFEDALEDPPESRARGSTFDIEEDQKDTEKGKNDVTQVNESAVQENNDQLASLNASVTSRRVQRGRRLDSDQQNQISEESESVSSTKRTRRGVKSVGEFSRRAQNTRKAKSLYINGNKSEGCNKEESANVAKKVEEKVSSDDADILGKKEPIISQKVSTVIEEEEPTIKESDVDMANVEEPGVNTKEAVDSKSTKEVPGPLFTIGKSGRTPKAGDNEGEGKPATKLPRFVAYARSLKMPNFNKIHAKAFKRMENLDEYMAKKKKVADLLGSGKKQVPPVDPSKVFKPSVTSAKDLSFNFGASKTPKGINKSSSIAKSQDSVTKPSLGRPTKASASKSIRSPGRKVLSAVKPKSPKEGKKVLRISPRGNKKLSKASLKGAQKLSKSNVKSGTNIKPLTETALSGRKALSPKQNTKPSKDVPDHKMNLNKTSPKNQTRLVIPRRASPRLQSLTQSQKENLVPAKSTPAKSLLNLTKVTVDTPGSAQRRQSYNPQATQDKPLRYKPHTGALKPFVEPSKVHHSRETLKNLAAKNPNVKSRQQIRDGQKKILKGVRTNKRFELQMAMRGLDA
ncbi:uncharacterized protein LOC143024710 isoform X2 [Oratosquilla oratoria]|uniref:uncharacterized protein LOC143024710 isoform X2 n=1 Tax=Oratosquilla oratoria TaxID=337810 RepID=UPI003F76ACDF